jgi:hypothetical protein
MSFNLLDPLCKAYKKGDPGPAGPAPRFVNVSAYSVAYGQQPVLQITGISPNLTFKLGVPAGAPGSGGSGTAGNVNGPVISQAGHMALFADATGKLLSVGPLPFGGNWNDLSGKPSSFTPSGHAASHKGTGSDVIRLDELGNPTNITTLNATTGQHGLLPKLPGDASKYLDGTGQWSLPPTGGSVPANTVTSTGTIPDGHLAKFIGTTNKLIGDGGLPPVVPPVGSTAGTLAAGDDPRFGDLIPTNTAWLKAYSSRSGKGNYDLEADYGLNAVNGTLKLAELYLQGVAATKFPKLFQWFTGAGWSTADIMQIRHFPACQWDAVLNGHTAGNWGTGRIGSRNGVTWPAGVYHHNIGSVYDSGHYVGKGTASSYGGSAGTVLVLDKEGWLDPDPFAMNVLQSSVGEVWNGQAYIEGGLIDEVRLEGLDNAKWYDSSYESNGIFLRGAGEVMRLGRVKTNGFNGHGLKITGGTPLDVDHISSFSNSLGAVGIIGGSLSTNGFGTISCDDNPCIFRVRDGYGVRSGGTVNVGRIGKFESGARTPHVGQILVEADGFTGPNANEGSLLNLTVDNYQYAMQQGRTHALCVVRGFQDGLSASDFTSPRKARVQIGSMLHWSSDYLMHCLGTRRAWKNDPDFTMAGFVWNGSTGLLSRHAADGTAPSPEVRMGTRRLGIKTVEASWDDVAAYDETGGGTIIPDPPFGSDWIEQVCVGVVPSEISVGDSAQVYRQGINVDYRLRNETSSYSIVSGGSLASVDPTGKVTAIAPGTVKIQVSMAGSAGFVTLHII